MTEEVPFRSVRVTLSDEAMAMVAELRRTGSLRSDSATIEECIRAVYDVYEDMQMMGRVAKQQERKVSINEQAESYRRHVIRLSRFFPKEG